MHDYNRDQNNLFKSHVILMVALFQSLEFDADPLAIVIW